MVHNDNKTVGFTSCHSRLFKLTGSVWIRAPVCTVSACAHCTTVRGHHRTEITPPPQPQVSCHSPIPCVCSRSASLAFPSHAYIHTHTHTPAHSANQRSEKGHLCLPGLPGDKEEAVIRGIDPVGASLADHYPATGVSTAAVAAVMLQENNYI